MSNDFFASFCSSLLETDDFRNVNCDSHMPQEHRQIIRHGNLHKGNIKKISMILKDKCINSEDKVFFLIKIILKIKSKNSTTFQLLT